MRVLIPSAKAVPDELQALGKLPAVIYPVNGHTVFSYLYKQYLGLSEIEVLCYENAGKVHKKLEKYKDINIVDIPELRDLAHTIYYGLDGVDGVESVIINFGDTIVTDNIFDNESDCFYYSKDYVSDKWTYFDIENGVLRDIYDKKKLAVNSSIKKKLFVGVFYLADAQTFKKCLEIAFVNKNTSISAFYQALKLYSEIHCLNAIETLKWFDIGHADKYYNTRLEVKAREFNHIDIDRDRGILTKYSKEKDKFIGEIKWYLKLPSDIEYVRPRIFDYSVDYNNPFVSMEYYAYHTVHELFLNGDLDIHQWEVIFEHIRFICHDMKRYKVQDENIKLSLEDMYLTKTTQRFEKLKKDDRFTNFFYSSISVNGKEYKSLNKVLDILNEKIPEMLYDVKNFNIIHGDLCFTNMMLDNNFSFIKVIDPRGKFGSYDIYGDSRYELAKLFHSVDGKYDYIIKDLFDLTYENGEINYSIQDKDREFDLYPVFRKVFKDEIGKDLKKIELIEALLFLSMIPLHCESFEHQLVMLGTGLEILNRIVNVEE
mgnify:CR=1 FL=1